MLDKCGFFDEDYGKYGMEHVDWSMKPYDFGVQENGFFDVVGYEAQDTFLTEAPPAPDLVSGNDTLLGQAVDGLHMNLEEHGDLRWGDYFLQLPLAPFKTLTFPCVPSGSLTARAMPGCASSDKDLFSRCFHFLTSWF